MYNMYDHIMRYEDGELIHEETVELFQHLIDTGTAWVLQGSYGRTAKAFIDAGLCTPGRE
jgi:hypothetical protein